MCFNSTFRLSHFRLPDDLLPLLTLRYPVRCRTCEHRAYASLWFARRLRHHAQHAPHPGS